MKKLILICGALVIAIIIILVIGISRIGPLIKSAVNTYGPDITKTDVHLEDVNVSIFSVEAKINGFYLGNPQGFRSPEAMRVKSIFLNVDEGSLTKDTIIIERVEVARPEITYEKAKRTDNFKRIIDNVKETVGTRESPKEKSKEGKDGKKLLIRNFIVKDGKVTLVTSLLGGKSISAPLPDIHLKNVGGEKEGASPAKVSKEILIALYGKITSSTVTDILNKELKKTLRTSLEEVSGGAKEELGGVSEKVTGLFGK